MKFFKGREKLNEGAPNVGGGALSSWSFARCVGVCVLCGVGFCVGFCVGCGGPAKPDGLPELTPCRVTLTQNGEPLADATTRFVYQGDGDVGRWAVAGVSNEKGVVEVLTHGQFKGAPAGRYAVVVTKEETEQNGETAKVYSLVAPEFTLQTSTPLTLEVGSDSVAETFELGEPTRELLDEFATSPEP